MDHVIATQLQAFRILLKIKIPRFYFKDLENLTTHTLINLLATSFPFLSLLAPSQSTPTQSTSAITTTFAKTQYDVDINKH